MCEVTRYSIFKAKLTETTILNVFAFGNFLPIHVPYL